MVQRDPSQDKARRRENGRDHQHADQQTPGRCTQPHDARSDRPRVIASFAPSAESGTAIRVDRRQKRVGTGSAERTVSSGKSSTEYSCAASEPMASGSRWPSQGTYLGAQPFPDSPQARLVGFERRVASGGPPRGRPLSLNPAVQAPVSLWPASVSCADLKPAEPDKTAPEMGLGSAQGPAGLRKSGHFGHFGRLGVRLQRAGLSTDVHPPESRTHRRG